MEENKTYGKLEERAWICAELLMNGFSPNHIFRLQKKQFEEDGKKVNPNYWNVSERQVMKYVARARQIILEETDGELRQQKIALAYRRYNNLYFKALKGNNIRMALEIQKSICELFGLNDKKPLIGDVHFHNTLSPQTPEQIDKATEFLKSMGEVGE